MLTTIRELMKRYNLEQENTVYRLESSGILDYPLTAGDFFENLYGMEKGKNYYDIYGFYQACREEEGKRGIPQLLKKVEQNLKQAEKVKSCCRGEEKKVLLEQLKEERRILRREIALHMEASYETAIKSYGESPDKLQFFEYKNRVLVTSFENITRMVPELGAAKLEELRKFPWLTTSLSKLRGAVCQGEELGVVGGPCLFGMDEVLLQVETAEGKTELFDCSCGRNCAKNPDEQAIILEDYLGLHRHRIKSLHILNRKTGITRQEYISLLYVFEIAGLLGGKVVIPLPDLSYIKYMTSDIMLLEEPLKQQIFAEFETEAYKITDLFLEVIGILKTRYPGLPVTVLHSREKELCRIFYDKREPFIRDSSYMRKLTSVNGKKDAVIDYITMLALPYYIYGTRQIVQVDSLDETDSGRKCQKIHGDTIKLHSVLYPEFISRDGKNTIYNAGIEYKDYMESGEY
ncbi:MAG: hypothetical protein LBS02_15720 [Hungatella sp.]|jgi:hypothetical protein|nr:hypothetical protein [Hungatella sp.]